MLRLITRPRFWLLALLLLLLLGAASLLIALNTNRTKDKWDRVQIGMTRDQLEKIMMDDDCFIEETEGEQCMTWLNHDGIFWVYLKDHKVTRKFGGEEPMKYRLKELWRELTHGRRNRGVAFP